MLHGARLAREGGRRGGVSKAIWAMSIWKQHISKRVFPDIAMIMRSIFYGLYTVNQDLCCVNVFDDFYGMKAFSFIISRHIFKLDEIRVMEPKSQKYAIDGAECLSEFFADEL